MKVEKLIISETHDQCSYCENKEDNDTGIVYKFGRTKIGLNVVSTICPNCLKELNKLVLNNFLKPIKGKLKIEWEDEEEICDQCYDTKGFYLGTTCPKCRRPFRSVRS